MTVSLWVLPASIVSRAAFGVINDDCIWYAHLLLR